MAEKSLFFNALADSSYETGYDRNYSADDISEWMSVVWENGIVKDGLKVNASSGMNIVLTTGRAAIKGKAYINNAIKTFTIATAPTTTTRYDYIVLRYNNNIGVRSIAAYLVTGTSSIPTAANLRQDDEVFELMLCYIAVGVGVTSISQANINDSCRGDATLCPFFTAVKGYDDYYDAIIQRFESVITMNAAGTNVISNLPSSLYNDQYSILEIYTNGIKEDLSNYSLITSGANIQVTFASQKTAGSKITFSLGNFIDGEGLSTAIDSYNDWIADVESLKAKNEYNYICNGVNDNVVISNLVKTFLNGGNDNGSMKLNIVGSIGMTSAARGAGTSSDPYGWFDFYSASSSRKVIIDFSNCSAIQPTIASGSYTSIFYGYRMTIIGANVVANNNATSTRIRIFNAAEGEIYAESCRFWINSYQDSVIGFTGTFNNCRGSVSNLINNSYCFQPYTQSLLRLIGGEYYSYTGSSTNSSAVIGQSGTNAATILYGVNAPVAARSGYYQTNSLLQWSGGGILNCTDLVSTLPMIVVTGISNIRGTIQINKPNLM